MYGEKIMVISPLLKWYVQHSLKVTKIHQVVEYTPATCFQKFGDNISDARRAGGFVLPGEPGQASSGGLFLSEMQSTGREDI
jgi:hypothetical protein